MKRRNFLKCFASLSLGYYFGGITQGFSSDLGFKKKIIVLGIDGMDPYLTKEYMRRGLMPNFTKLALKGSLTPVASSVPPQSPVAWSNFIVGAPPYIHGIYDFIHRHPQSMAPYFSTSQVIPPDRVIALGDWNIPLSNGGIESLRKGRPFWDFLADRDIPTTLFKMPTNFPCENGKIKMTSGMGTPDLRGGFGSYTLLTTNPGCFKEDISGGKIIPLIFDQHKTVASLPGPVNTLRKNNPESFIPITIWRDFENSVVRVHIQDKELLLKSGEWSDWIPLSFPMAHPIYYVKGIVKLLIKSIHPDFSMYISPINIDPSDPVLPVISSRKYSEELLRNVGYFYTQGFPEDTKALSEGILNEEEYIAQALQAFHERRRLLDYELKQFLKQDMGMLFFYFSTLDQNTHMYYRAIDMQHPLYSPELGQKYGHTLQKIYSEMDSILGDVLNQFDVNDSHNTLIVMSDHGFVSFRRQVNLNNWLFENDFLSLKRRKDIKNKGYFEDVNWSKTAAYNVGINSIYLNIKGRERNGVVSMSQRNSLLKNMGNKLLKLIDPAIGQAVVSRIWIIPEGEHRRNHHAPDMIIGWNSGYRNSWSSILGGFSNNVLSDNLDKWSGDHCVDAALVPGTLMTNKKILLKDPSLYDITATILGEFRISLPNQFKGKKLYNI